MKKLSLELVQVILRPIEYPSAPLVMTVPPVNASRHGVEPGRRLRVRLRGESIRITPGETS